MEKPLSETLLGPCKKEKRNLEGVTLGIKFRTRWPDPGTQCITDKKARDILL